MQHVHLHVREDVELLWHLRCGPEGGIDLPRFDIKMWVGGLFTKSSKKYVKLLSYYNVIQPFGGDHFGRGQDGVKRRMEPNTSPRGKRLPCDVQTFQHVTNV